MAADPYNEWAESVGVRFFHNVHVQELPEPLGRGVIADETIPSKKTVFSVPLSAMLSELNVNECGVAPVLALKTELAMNEDDVLALALMYEKIIKGAKSRWYEHIQRLPTTMDNAFYFSRDEIKALEGSNLFAIAQQMQSQIRMDYARIFPTLFERFEALGITPRSFTIDEYKWAIATIWSRFVSIKIAPGRFVKAMVPFFDMLNHDPRVKSHHEFDEKSQCLKFVADQKFTKGEQLTFCYGPSSNAELLQFKGFVVPDNPFDTVSVFCSMSPEAENYARKLALLGAAGLNLVDPFLVSKDRLNERFLAAVRIQRADVAELAAAEKSFRGERISIENERRVLTSVSTSFKSMIDEYPRAGEVDALADEFRRVLTSVKSRAATAAAASSGGKKKGKGKAGISTPAVAAPSCDASGGAGGPAPAPAASTDSIPEAAAPSYRMQCIAMVQQSEIAILKAQIRLLAEARVALEAVAAKASARAAHEFVDE